MSQNFELLRQLETQFPFADVVSEDDAVVATSAERVNENGFPQELLTLAQTLFLSGEVNTRRQVVFCGIDRDSASSEICVNLGRILATYSVRPVCLVDANPGSPGLEKMLRPDQPLSFPDPIRDRCREMAPNLWITEIDMTGSLKQPSLAPAPRVKEQLADLREKFEFVLIHTAGVNARPEAAVFGQQVDGIVLVLEANVTRKAAALRAARVLENMNVRIIGSVLNNRTFPIPERLYQKL